MLALSRWKIFLVLGSVIFGLLFAAPNFMPDSMLAQWPGFLPHLRLNLGLDLQGGSSLLYGLDTDALKQERLTDLAEETSTQLQQAQIPFQGLNATGGVVSFKLNNPGQTDATETALAKVGGSVNGAREVSVSHDDKGAFTVALTPQATQQMIRNALTTSIEIVRRRIDTLGTKEPDIRQQGADRIVIEAPGVSDPGQLKNLIGQTGKLTFQMVDSSVQPINLQTLVPPDEVVLPYIEDKNEPFIVVKKHVAVDGATLTHAQQAFNQQNQPVIAFRFNGAGAHRFADVTSNNVGQRFAIVLDGKVISAPRIDGPIIGGDGEIHGGFSIDSANELANVLNSGALPAKLNVLEEQRVGADLGADAVRAGVTGLAIGAALIFAFIILAYGLYGVFAAVALIVNLILIVGALSVPWTGGGAATLTLPGIAGIILTLAVAVDANVLIYERMRDEAHAGRAAMAAADAGYRRAWTSIFDANVTTLLSAVIMFGFGAGPVKGFALTLAIGVVTSVFSAWFVTQLLIGWWFRLTRAKALPIA